MRVNQHTGVSTPAILLVPYEAHHVPRYHSWMKDPEILELTASEPLSLDEEYENQQDWRTSGDKLTFIVCLPGAGAGAGVRAGVDDAEDRMVGDVNLFLYPDDPCSPQDAEYSSRAPQSVFGEVDVMIAPTPHRGKGLGKAAVRALLAFVSRNLGAVLAEYASSAAARPAQQQQQQQQEAAAAVEMTRLLARIKDANEPSKVLFGKLGFAQRGGANYFGEVEMVLEGFGTAGDRWDVEGYEEVEYGKGKVDGETSMDV